MDGSKDTVPASGTLNNDKKVAASTPEVHVEVVEDLDPELEKLLQTEPLKGLTDVEAAERLEKFGKNEIPEKKHNPFLKFLSYFGGPISFLLEVAALISAIVGDWIDFGIILVVLILNACIGYFEEAKAESALDALKNTLALKSRTYRNGHLDEVESCMLVPGDIISLRLGDIIPADCRLLGIGVTGDAADAGLQIDQSALTGESLPVIKHKNAIAYSSSIVKQGQMLGVVTKTGIHTYIGRAANLISMTNDMGHFQKVINNIGNFLIGITLVMVLILLIVFCTAKGLGFLDSLKSVLVLTIAAIPVGLPTVMSVTMAVGAKQLAAKQVIVKRLTAIEELASVSILCSDKTGTLTLNELTFDTPYLAQKGNTSTNFAGSGAGPYEDNDLLMYAYCASEPGAMDAIELAVRSAAEDRVPAIKSRPDQKSHVVPGYSIKGFIPFNPHSKYTEATVFEENTKQTYRVIKGAPQVIVSKCGGHTQAEAAVLSFAKRGLRALGVARTIDAEMQVFEMVGMISLLDPPRPDSGTTIRECNELGIGVKMITGDQLIIAKEVAQRLGMNQTILDAHKLIDSTIDEEAMIDRVEKADGFAQVIPEHKYRVVELLQKRGYLVGMTGDGVNDAPALKKANVGIAVQGCTDAARSAADIVLLAAGLSTIVDGVKCSRAIFQRMRSYAVYRITSTIHFLLFFFISLLVFEFALPDRLIILIAVLNDAATLVISVDNAKISKRPDKWRLGQLLTLSFILGLLLMGISFAHFFVAQHLGIPLDKITNSVNDGRLQTIMYLQISSCPHFVIFSTRLPTWFWVQLPSPIFVLAVAGTQVFAMFMSIYGIAFFDATAIGWPWGVSVLSISIISFMLLDIVKVLIIRHWSFELTAKLWPSPSRMAKLHKKEEHAAMKKRVDVNVEKLRNAVRTVNVVSAFQDYSKTRVRDTPVLSAAMPASG
ncbi:H+-exporting ATPase [Synchytrium microbalum]|uniref:Plasma membrane ATPase n=1 Tax=Synchytrium microbalum TaxID=1806994 RepID=A0A507C6K9_9FUNG|nr:H+-exporting ATPase [Synchytrium microbalum]TPX33115.1 H+-exporting ATPase [Synchytrium microbalum]